MFALILVLTVQSPLCSSESWPTPCLSPSFQPDILRSVPRGDDPSGQTHMGAVFCSGTIITIAQLPVPEKPRHAGRALAPLQISKGCPKAEGAESSAGQEGRAKTYAQSHRRGPFCLV